MPIVLTRATKLEARYKALGGREHCSACRFYMPQGTCGRIIGPVSPEGWCKYYSREAVQRWSNPGYAGSGGGLPAGATLDLGFMAPGVMPPLITFTRASTATYTDSTGTIQTAAVNAPRWDYDPVTHQLRGLLIEQARTNVLLNSATLGTQSVAVTAQAYTLSFYGTGTIAYSGAAAGSLVGTGTQRVSATFTPAAGTLTCTVTGSVLNAQLEAGGLAGFITSYIPTTSASVTRAFDNCYIAPANTAPWFASPGGSWFAEFINNVPTPVSFTSPRVIGIHDGTSLTPIWVPSTPDLSTYDGSQVSTLNTVVLGAVSKGASNWAPGIGRICLNGGAVGSGAMNTGFATLATAGIGILGGNPGVVNETMTGYIRRVSYWPRVLANAEMQAVTT